MSFTSSCLRLSRLATTPNARNIYSVTYSRRAFTTTGIVRAEPTASTSSESAPETKDSKGKQSSDKSLSAEKPGVKKRKEDGVPLLWRPLGLKTRPTAVAKTWTEEMLDDKTRKDHRNKLLNAATKGYFTDLNATRKFGGKTWIAPSVLIRQDKALYFPDIKGTPLSGKAEVHTTDLLLGKVSVVQLLSSKISELQTQMFCKPTHEAFEKNPRYQLVQINAQDNLLKSLLVNLFLRNTRRSIPTSQWDKYLVSRQNLDYIRDDLGNTNRHLGYVYLVDDQCRVRWAGCADPMPQEVEALKVCTEVLLKRYKS